MEVVSPAAVAATDVPMIRLPAVVVALPSEIAAVVPSERKSVIWIAPAVMLVFPVNVEPVDVMVRRPVPDLVTTCKAPDAVMLPATRVLPLPPKVRVRAVPSLLPQTPAAKVRVPPVLLVIVFWLLDDSCVQAWNVIP